MAVFNGCIAILNKKFEHIPWHLLKVPWHEFEEHFFFCYPIWKMDNWEVMLFNNMLSASAFSSGRNGLEWTEEVFNAHRYFTIIMCPSLSSNLGLICHQCYNKTAILNGLKSVVYLFKCIFETLHRMNLDTTPLA